MYFIRTPKQQKRTISLALSFCRNIESDLKKPQAPFDNNYAQSISEASLNNPGLWLTYDNGHGLVYSFPSCSCFLQFYKCKFFVNSVWLKGIQNFHWSSNLVIWSTWPGSELHQQEIKEKLICLIVNDVIGEWKVW